MKLFRSIVILFLSAFLMQPNTSVLAQDTEEEDECPNPEGWPPTEQELEDILALHAEWLQTGSVNSAIFNDSPLDEASAVDPRRANLCNAILSTYGEPLNLEEKNLFFAKLDGTSLEGAILNWANLTEAELNGANLTEAKLNGASLIGAKLNCLELDGGSERCVNLRFAKLNGSNLYKAELNWAYLREAKLNCLELDGGGEQCAVLFRAKLNGANLQETELNGAYLYGAELNGAYLGDAELNGANLWRADLNRANLTEAELNCLELDGGSERCVNLRFAKLNGADLSDADLGEANLFEAKLNNAKLWATNIEEVNLAFADLENALYAPIGTPSIHGLGNIRNLKTVWFYKEAHSGLVQLQKALEEAGLRELEREATYALEYGKTQHLLWDLHPKDPEYKLNSFWRRVFVSTGVYCKLRGLHQKFYENCNDIKKLPSFLSRTLNESFQVLNGVFRLVAFEWTTEYGLKPGQALLILLVLLWLMPFVYVFPILRESNTKKKAGIYQVLPEKRLDFPKAKPVIAKDEPVSRLSAKGLPAFWWALYFSLLSATTIGWRELNVGNWVSRVQPQEFGLRGRGWVRVVSGAQSLISVYLLAIWALTYFGRPFQ